MTIRIGSWDKVIRSNSLFLLANRPSGCFFEGAEYFAAIGW